MLSRIKFEIEGLVSEILEQLPKSVWTSDTTTFLDPAVGGGQFVRAIEQRLRAHGHSEDNIRNRVYGCESSRLNVNYALNKYRLVGRYAVCDFLEQDFRDMKFDVVLGNPPYQEGGREDQANKLWPQFVKKSYDLVKSNGYVAMITPNGWMQPTADIGKGTGKNALSIFNDLFKKNNLILANIDSDGIRETHFKGVGSTFSYYIFQKSLYSGSTEFTTTTGKVTIDISKIDSLPKVTCKESLSIVKKMVGNPFVFCDQNHGLNGVEGDTQQTVSQVKTSKGGAKTSKHKLQYAIYHTNKNGGTYWYGEKLNPYANKPKVIISLSGSYKPVFNNTTGFSNMCLALICNTDNEATIAQTILSSKLYRFWVDMQKFSGFNPRKLILMLPELDLSKDWTDEKIYKHFNLTQEEIDYIEANVK